MSDSHALRLWLGADHSCHMHAHMLMHKYEGLNVTFMPLHACLNSYTDVSAAHVSYARLSTLTSEMNVGC